MDERFKKLLEHDFQESKLTDADIAFVNDSLGLSNKIADDVYFIKKVFLRQAGYPLSAKASMLVSAFDSIIVSKIR